MAILRAVDVANFFIDLANKNPNNEDGITNLRVNKLVYFAQVWSLVCLQKPLFHESIEAWQHGPVIPSVYTAFKGNKSDKIRETKGVFSLEIFDSDEISLLLDVVRNYDQYSSWKLADLTHVKGGPWESVYRDGETHIKISEESIKEYYSQISFDRYEFAYNPDTDVVGYRDNDNYLVLPKDYDDSE